MSEGNLTTGLIWPGGDEGGAGGRRGGCEGMHLGLIWLLTRGGGVGQGGGQGGDWGGAPESSVGATSRALVPFFWAHLAREAGKMGRGTREQCGSNKACSAPIKN